MTQRWTILTIIIGIPVSASIAQDSTNQKNAPKVVSVSPAIGAEDIDPTTREIRVTFDMPMDQSGFSFTGGGPSFPRPNGKVKWLDAKTCVLPVKLDPNKRYEFGINSQSHMGFRSYWHVPVNPVRCHFTTGGSKAIRITPEEQRRRNIDAYDALCDAIRRKYSYVELRNVDWESHFAEHRPRVVKQTDTPSWTQAVADMLAVANDVHITLEYNDQTYPTFIRRVDPNLSANGIKQTVSNLTQINPTVTTGTIGEDIAYIFIQSFASQRSNDIDAVIETIENTAATALILDVRANSGGSESLAATIAARFITDDRVYAKHVFRRGANPSDFTPIRNREIKPAGKTFANPVAVLMGPKNMSSCEAFLLMMKQAPNATLIGQRTYGSSGNPNAVYLPNDVKLMLPSWKALRPDGSCFETEGIAPDIGVSADPTDADDAILNRAIAHLRAKTSGDATP